MALREDMLEMLDCTRIEDNYEWNGNLMIAVSFAVITNSNVYIWAENNLHIYVRLLKSWGLNVSKVICTAPKDFQKVDDVEIISYEDLPQDDTPNKIFFVDASLYNEDDKDFIRKVLANTACYFFCEDDRIVMIANHPDFDNDKLYYYQSHKSELMELFDSLADETSKRTLYYYVESYVKNCTYRGEHNFTRCKYFFGGKYERLYKHLDGECWINCGASIGDTIFSYFSWGFKPKRIYAFEGDKTAFDFMQNKLMLLPPEMRELVEPINEMIDETTDFEKILSGNKCTLLNADIEGAELKLLHAMKKIIQADRPVMAICVYHFAEDLLSVPQFLQSNCRDYIYYLRKYTPWHYCHKKNHELIFYAVPRERAI